MITEFTLKMHQLSVRTTPEEFKNAITTAHLILDLCLRKTRSGKSHDYRNLMIVIENLSSFTKCFQSTLKRKAGVFKFLRFQSVSEKLRFRDGLVWREGLTGVSNSASARVHGALLYSSGIHEQFRRRLFGF